MKDDDFNQTRITPEQEPTDKTIPAEELNDISGGWVFMGMPLTPQWKPCEICGELISMRYMQSHMKEHHGK